MYTKFQVCSTSISWDIKEEWKMEKFSNIFGSLVFLVIHKTKMNCEEIFALKELEVTPEAYIIADISPKIQRGEPL